MSRRFVMCKCTTCKLYIRVYMYDYTLHTSFLILQEELSYMYVHYCVHVRALSDFDGVFLPDFCTSL